MVMLCVANVGRIRCLWAVCSECGPICSESGSQLRFIWSQCGPSREMFVGLRDYVWGPLHVAMTFVLTVILDMLVGVLGHQDLDAQTLQAFTQCATSCKSQFTGDVL